jgi:hypothetical protein
MQLQGKYELAPLLGSGEKPVGENIALENAECGEEQHRLTSPL